MDDAAIIDLYLAREEDAIIETSIKYGSRLRGISHGIIRDPEISKECENDTYLKAWQRIPPDRPYTYFFHYLACIIRSVSIDVWRSQHRLMRSAHIVELTKELEQCIPAHDDPAAEVDRKLLGQIISRYVASLPLQKKVIFLRRYWYMDSITDIARRLSVKESKIKITLYRCRNELRNILEKEGYNL
jgi:RNA polymerase sigma-70 factor (ECF subfamily)